jgi:hypothetical protein
MQREDESSSASSSRPLFRRRQSSRAHEAACSVAAAPTPPPHLHAQGCSPQLRISAADSVTADRAVARRHPAVRGVVCCCIWRSRAPICGAGVRPADLRGFPTALRFSDGNPDKEGGHEEEATAAAAASAASH